MAKDEKLSGGELLGIAALANLMVVLVACFVVGEVLLGGFVLMTLWAWFVVPQFGLPALGIVSAIGVRLTARAFFGHRASAKSETPWRDMLTMTAQPLLLLGTGYIITLFL